MRVLAVGATGLFAGLVVPALVARGVQVRALGHDPAKADRVRELGAEEAVAGDLRERESIDKAPRHASAKVFRFPDLGPASRSPLGFAGPGHGDQGNDGPG